MSLAQSPINDQILGRMEDIVQKLDKYKFVPKKEDRIREWNSIVHELDELMNEYGHKLPSRFRENIEVIINYTEPPQTEFSVIDSIKYDLEEAIEAFENADFSDQDPKVTRSKFIIALAAIGLAIFASILFYFTH